MAQQKRNPYPHDNFAVVADYLEEIALILSGERGVIPINENGYQDMTVSHTKAVQLSVPENAISASIFFEADSSTENKDCIIRFKENGEPPTASSGQAWGHKDIFNPIGKQVLDKLSFIGIEADKIHHLRIQYYQSSQAQ